MFGCFRSKYFSNFNIVKMIVTIVWSCLFHVIVGRIWVNRLHNLSTTSMLTRIMHGLSISNSIIYGKPLVSSIFILWTFVRADVSWSFVFTPAYSSWAIWVSYIKPSKMLAWYSSIPVKQSNRSRMGSIGRRSIDETVFQVFAFVSRLFVIVTDFHKDRRNHVRLSHDLFEWILIQRLPYWIGRESQCRSYADRFLANGWQLTKVLTEHLYCLMVFGIDGRFVSCENRLETEISVRSYYIRRQTWPIWSANATQSWWSASVFNPSAFE